MSCSNSSSDESYRAIYTYNWTKIEFVKYFGNLKNPIPELISGIMIGVEMLCFSHANVDSNGQITQIEGPNLSYFGGLSTVPTENG